MNNHCRNCCNNCRGKLCASKVSIFQNLNDEELLEVVKILIIRNIIEGILFLQKEI